MYNEEAINDMIDEWHDSKTDLEVHQFLDLTLKEYFEWVENKWDLDK